MADRVRLTVPSEPGSVPLVEALAERWCAALDVPGDESERVVELAGDAVRFTLEHAYPGDPTGQIELTLDLAERFNGRFGETFLVPAPHIVREVAKK